VDFLARCFQGRAAGSLGNLMPSSPFQPLSCLLLLLPAGQWLYWQDASRAGQRDHWAAGCPRHPFSLIISRAYCCCHCCCLQASGFPGKMLPGQASGLIGQPDAILTLSTSLPLLLAVAAADCRPAASLARCSQGRAAGSLGSLMPSSPF
jgi:hypothetical protein